MMHKLFLLCTIFLITVPPAAFGQQDSKEIIIAEGLSIIPLSKNVYQHISDFTWEKGKVKCNGLLYINGNEGIICDTPTNDELSKHLLNWISENHPDVKIKAVIVNHFHEDCLGGLAEFHRAGIKSYAHALGPELMKIKNDSSEVPQNLFNTLLEIKVGNKKIINYYVGEAHTRDNIITWIPSEKTIFGGCMVKSMNADKGNLADANVKEWSNTIQKIKDTCPQAKLIIPGHGNAGGQELLDYTIELFK